MKKIILLLTVVTAIFAEIDYNMQCLNPPIPTPPDGCIATDAVLECEPGCECTWYFDSCYTDPYKRK